MPAVLRTAKPSGFAGSNPALSANNQNGPSRGSNLSPSLTHKRKGYFRMSATSIVARRRRIGGAAGTHFSTDEVRALLTAARSQSERDWLLILVTLTHGLRASEAVGLVAGDIRDGHLWVARLKGSARTCQPLIGDEREPLVMLASGKGLYERLFPITRMQFWRIMRKHCETAGLSPVAAHPHSLKHTLCRTVLAETGNLQVVKQYAGHSSITSTLRYTKPTDAEASRAAADGLNWMAGAL